MRTIGFLVAVCALGLSTVPAAAQATRTWVSGVGDDANPCSRIAPCKTFAGAISKTAAGGAINTLDPGGFGSVTITKNITIRSDGVEAGVLVSGTNGINVIVNVGSTGSVVLEGLEPPRVCRRLQLLRDWSHDNRIKIPKVLCRGS